MCPAAVCGNCDIDVCRLAASINPVVEDYYLVFRRERTGLRPLRKVFGGAAPLGG